MTIQRDARKDHLLLLVLFSRDQTLVLFRPMQLLSPYDISGFGLNRRHSLYLRNTFVPESAALKNSSGIFLASFRFGAAGREASMLLLSYDSTKFNDEN